MSRGAYTNQYVTGRIVHEMWTHDGTCRCIVLSNDGQHVRATVLGCDAGRSMLNRRVKCVDGHWVPAEDLRRAAA